MHKKINDWITNNFFLLLYSYRVKNKNAAALPNVGFQAQLCLYETLGWKIDKENMQFKLYRLKLAARKVKKG